MIQSKIYTDVTYVYKIHSSSFKDISQVINLIFVIIFRFVYLFAVYEMITKFLNLKETV